MFLLLELVPPVLAALTVWRMMERPGSVIWTIIVLHSNIVLWSGILIYIFVFKYLSVLFSRSSAFIMLGTHSCRGPGVTRYNQ